jgi:hypothetical protein
LLPFHPFNIIKGELGDGGSPTEMVKTQRKMTCLPTRIHQNDADPPRIHHGSTRDMSVNYILVRLVFALVGCIFLLHKASPDQMRKLQTQAYHCKPASPAFTILCTISSESLYLLRVGVQPTTASPRRLPSRSCVPYLPRVSIFSE